MLRFKRRIDFDLDIGESPCWDGLRGCLWFVDATAPAIHSMAATTGEVRSWTMPATVGSLGLASGGGLVVALRTGVHLFDPRTGDLQFLVHPEPDMPVNRLNDGKVGPDGCFWIGSMHDAFPRQPTASLYRITPQGGCTRVLHGIRNSNGLAWSPDGRTMYHADTREPSITAYDFDKSDGRLSSPRILAEPTQREGLPDGAAVDAEGYYWSAGITAGLLNKVSPHGGIVASHLVPAPAPTMPCFGGADMRTLFLTSLSSEQDGRKVAGTLMSCSADVPGVPGYVFGTP